MKAVHGRPDAKWLPSRFRYALFRLIAFVRMSFSSPVRDERSVIVIDRDQNAVESWCVAASVVAVTIAFLASALESIVPLAAAVALAIVLTPWVLQIPLYAVGVFLPNRESSREVVSIVTLTALAAASVTMAMHPGWERVPAVVFLALLVLNAVAAVVLLPLRRAIAALERRCGD